MTKKASMAPADAPTKTPVPLLVPSSDDKGVGVTVSARCPPEIARHISELTTEAVAKGNYPWKTKGDTIRFLLTSALQRIDEAREDDSPFLAQHRLSTALDEARLARQEADALFHTTFDEVTALLRVDPHEAELLLQRCLRQVLELADSAWKDQLVTRLEDRFPQLLHRESPARLKTRKKLRDVIKKKTPTRRR